MGESNRGTVVAWMNDREAWPGTHAPTQRGLYALVLASDYEAERAAREAAADELSAARTRILVLEGECGESEAQLSAMRSRCEGLAEEWSELPVISTTERGLAFRQCADELRELLGAP